MKQRRKTRKNLRSSRKVTLYKKHKLKGGMKIAMGADTCVFKPAIGCKDNMLPPNLAGPGFVSRVVKKTTPDVKTELFINTHFPSLVQSGFIAVGQHFCTPNLKDTNLQLTQKLSNKISNYARRGQPAPCSVIQKANENEFANMVTKAYDMDLHEFLTLNSVFKANDLLMVLRGAVNAAVALVPDNGPWVIHTDCHYGNILVNLSPPSLTALADWGRCIVIIDPNDPIKVKEGLQMGARSTGSSSYKEFQDRFGEALNNYPQHPFHLIKKIVAYEKDLNEKIGKVQFPKDFNKYLPYLRGWTAFAILSQASLRLHGNPNVLVPLLECKSQAELQATINKYITIPNYVTITTIKESAKNVKPIVNAQTAAMPLKQMDKPMSLNVDGNIYVLPAAPQPVVPQAIAPTKAATNVVVPGFFRQKAAEQQAVAPGIFHQKPAGPPPMQYTQGVASGIPAQAVQGQAQVNCLQIYLAGQQLVKEGKEIGSEIERLRSAISLTESDLAELAAGKQDYRFKYSENGESEKRQLIRSLEGFLSSYREQLTSNETKFNELRNKNDYLLRLFTQNKCKI